MVEKVIITFVIAFFGAIIARKLKVPVPFMLGSLIAVAAFSVLTDQAIMPSEVRLLTQTVTGTYIGKMIFKKDILGLKVLYKSVIILIGGFAIFTLTMGLFLHHVFDFDIATAFLVAVPGGVVDMSLISLELKGNPATVSLIQSTRLIFVLAAFPIIIKNVSKRFPKKPLVVLIEEAVTRSKFHLFFEQLIPNKSIIKNIFTLTVGAIGGYIGYLSNLPAGALTFSMITVSIMNINTNRIDLPIVYRRFAQVAAGALIGVSVTRADILGIQSLIIPTLVVLLGYIIANFTISYFMYKWGKVDYVSAMFASSPGGASDMALIASEIAGDIPKIAILQISRLIIVIAVFPLYVKLLISIFS